MKLQRAIGFVFALALATVVLGAQAKPDFSGTWKFEAAKSDPQVMPPGMQAPPEPTQLVLTQTPEALTIDTGTAKSVYKLDGSPSTNPMNGLSVTTTSAWQGDALVTSGTIKAPNMTIDFSDTRVLSADGKTMTVTHHGKIADLGEATRKLIFTKN